ncbi:hypothetical protein B0T10DRAFT_585528 [Thelonectria olida]|uniref:Uncharacterized protein n=1 Tax=Thelonectria olida TaxID=1576542 RepID=A0A9P9AK25_9HYPO|nr:hypothetical protein B0T10DRAFT_585528 [Thelonectria olida]
MRFFRRIRHLGLLSLAALFGGSAILILVGVNVVQAPIDNSDPAGAERVWDSTYSVQFLYGAHLSVQSWLAIIGVAFGLLSYGYHEAYIHVFDWWCTRQSRRPEGLDYTRYLNSQIRAPVLYGIRGFPFLVSLRYFIAIASVAASIGYKFAVTRVDTYSYMALDSSQFKIRSIPSAAFDKHGAPSPWISDRTSDSDYVPANRAFLHQLERIDTDNQPPISVMMTAWAYCPDTFQPLGWGWVYTREVVMVANITEEKGDFVMRRNHSGWERAITSNNAWSDYPEWTFPGRAAVDYRVVAPGKAQIQWARLGSLSSDLCDSESEDDCDSAATQPVARRLTYTMHYAVAEVLRSVDHGSCSSVDGQPSQVDRNITASILSFNDASFVTEKKYGISSAYSGWVSAVISDKESTVLEGVAAFVRASMAGLATVVEDGYSNGTRLGLLDADDLPFGPEDASLARVTGRFGLGRDQYPYFQGFRPSGLTGCYRSAANVFFVLGSLSIAVALVRIWLGPPAVTGSTSIGGQLDELASGYEVAPVGLGTLRTGLGATCTLPGSRREGEGGK